MPTRKLIQASLQIRVPSCLHPLASEILLIRNRGIDSPNIGASVASELLYRLPMTIRRLPQSMSFDERLINHHIPTTRILHEECSIRCVVKQHFKASAFRRLSPEVN